MATIDKEQRARRKKMKLFHELNQLLKTVYRSYVIYSNSVIIGNAVLDKDKRPKDKYEHGYFKSNNILELFPELSNSCIFSNNAYLAFRDDKPEELFVKDETIFIKGELGTYKIGIILNTDMLTLANRKADIIGEEVSSVMNHIDNKIIFTDDMVDKLINYEKIIPKFNNDDELAMHLTISEFPFLKKFKQCIVYMCDSNKNHFDVVYSTFNDVNQFIMRRRFIKLTQMEDK